MTELKMTTLDCADPKVEVAFWSALLGWSVAASEDEYGMLLPPDGGAALGFGKVEGYQPAPWPNEGGSKQFHFDLGCEDIEASERQAVELGATVPDEQPGDTWRVLLDPAGHPFCLTKLENWG